MIDRISKKKCEDIGDSSRNIVQKFLLQFLLTLLTKSLSHNHKIDQHKEHVLKKSSVTNVTNI